MSEDEKKKRSRIDFDWWKIVICFGTVLINIRVSGEFLVNIRISGQFVTFWLIAEKVLQIKVVEFARFVAKMLCESSKNYWVSMVFTGWIFLAQTVPLSPTYILTSTSVLWFAVSNMFCIFPTTFVHVLSN